MPYTLTINPSCGDGIKTPDEQWDDGNSVSGDGWSNSWKIEANWTWTGGSLTSKDTWIWNKPSEEAHTSVSDEEIDTKILSYVFYGFILLAAIFNFITLMLSSGSVQSIFHYINQVQLQ